MNLAFNSYLVDGTEQETRVTDPETGGEKGKKLAQLGALDPVALYHLAEVAGAGANKYSAHNFLKGYSWSLSYDALQRHLQKFWMGEDVDADDQQLHLAHAAWHCLALLGFVIRDVGTDDRPPAYAAKDVQATAQLFDAATQLEDPCEDGEEIHHEAPRPVELVEGRSYRVTSALNSDHPLHGKVLRLEGIAHLWGRKNLRFDASPQYWDAASFTFEEVAAVGSDVPATELRVGQWVERLDTYWAGQPSQVIRIEPGSSPQSIRIWFHFENQEIGDDDPTDANDYRIFYSHSIFRIIDAPEGQEVQPEVGKTYYVFRASRDDLLLGTPLQVYEIDEECELVKFTGHPGWYYINAHTFVEVNE